MRYLLMVIPLFLVSCSPFGFNPMEYEELETPLFEAWFRVASMEYQPEPRGLDYWKSPHEFFEDGGGDCEDFAIALMYLLGPQSQMAIINVGPFEGHAFVKYKDEYFDPQLYNVRINPPAPILLLPYNLIMLMVTDAGIKAF